MLDEFEQEENRRKMEVGKEIYLMFGNEYVEVADKDFKGQLEVLGGRKWYEGVMAWLFDASALRLRGPGQWSTNKSGVTGSGGKALEYHRLLEAIDLLNRQNITMEEQSMSYGVLCRTDMLATCRCRCSR